MFCRLTCWIDQIVQFDFEIEQMQGSKTDIAYYLAS